MDKTKKKIKVSAESDSEKSVHLPKFLIKPGTQHRLVSDLANLLLWIFSETSGKMPKWIFVQNKHLISQIIIIFLPGLDLETLKSCSSSAPFLNSLISPTTCTYLHNKANQPYTMSFSTKPRVKQRNCLEDCLLSQTELIDNNYTLDRIKAKERSVPDNLKLVALDCEMVKCSEGIELARVTLVDKDFNVLYDEYIKPKSEVIDYLTKYSGITEEILSNAKIDCQSAQTAILDMISEETIICGHSLENDLECLGISHLRVIDTSVLYPHPNVGFKHSLKHLASKYLKKRIQHGAHDSVEDASAALELTLLKISKGSGFGEPAQESINALEVIECEGKKVVSLDSASAFQYSSYIDCEVIIATFTEIIQNTDFQSHEEYINKTLVDWDQKLQALSKAISPTTGLIIASGTGDTNFCEHLSHQRDLNFSAWTSEEEINWSKHHAKLNKTFGMFVFPSQVQHKII